MYQVSDSEQTGDETENSVPPGDEPSSQEELGRGMSYDVIASQPIVIDNVSTLFLSYSHTRLYPSKS